MHRIDGKQTVRILVLVSTIFLIFTACTAPFYDRIELDSGWYWAPEGAQLADFVPLPTGTMENLSVLLPSSSGVLWLRTTFYVPASLEGHDLSLYGGRIAFADRVWVNDVFIGGEGGFAPSTFDARWKARNYAIPAISLNRGTVNTLFVQMQVNREGFVTGRPFIGVRLDARLAAERTRFLYSTLFLLLSVLCLFVAVPSCVGRTPGWLYLALISAVTALRLVPYFEADMLFFLLNSPVYIRLKYVIGIGGLYIQLWLLSQWLSRYLGRKEPLVLKALLVLFMVLPLAGIVLFSNHPSGLEFIPWLRLLVVPPVLYIVYSVIESVIRRNERVLQFLVVMIPPLLCFPLYVLAILLTNTAAAFPFMSLFWPLLVILLHFIKQVALQPAPAVATVPSDPALIQCKNELTECRRLLDQQKQIRQLEEVAFSRFRCDLDAPSFLESGSWEVYKATVSGLAVQADLSAYYTGETGLEGLALFQASGGDGMAPVLPLVCGPLIEHCFREGSNRMLPDIMKTINDALCGVLAGFTGRLTGTLIRIKPDRLEYVNAGHPHVLLRSFKTARVREVRLSGKENRGPSLGSCGHAQLYTAVGFSMQNRDTLLLYTDLSGPAVSSQMRDEQASRISAAFATEDDVSPRTLMDMVIKACKACTAEYSMAADQTVILLCRKS